jgi:hypothetical protein
MEIDTEIREIKDLLLLLNEKMDVLIDEREVSSLMRLSEHALEEFFDEEPVLYSMEDLKVRYL